MNKLDAISPYLSLTVFIVASVVGSILGLSLLFGLLKYLHKKRGSYALLVILQHLKRPLYFLIPLLAIGIFTPILDLTGRLNIIPDLIQALVIFFFTWVLFEAVWSAEAIIKHHYSQVDKTGKRTLKTQIRFISRVLIVVIFVVMTAVFLMSFQNVKKLGVGILTSAGIASVIVGFAAQKTLGGIFAGFQVAFNRMLRIDDIVCIEGQCGQVEEITLMHVVIGLSDNRRLIVPITFFMEKSYQNWTLSAADITKAVELSLDYSVNLNEVRQALDRILEHNSLWDKKIKTMQVTSVTDKCMIVTILVSSHNTTDVDLLCSEIREQLMKFLYHHFPDSLPRNRTEALTRSEKS